MQLRAASIALALLASIQIASSAESPILKDDAPVTLPATRERTHRTNKNEVSIKLSAYMQDDSGGMERLDHDDRPDRPVIFVAYSSTRTVATTAVRDDREFFGGAGDDGMEKGRGDR